MSRQFSLAETGVLCALFFSIGLLLGGCAATPLSTREPREVYVTVNNAFVMVMTETDTGGTGQGSGTVVGERAGHHLVLTAAHLFHGKSKEAIVLVDLGTGEGEGYPGVLLDKDDSLDLALVEVRGHLNRKPIRIAKYEPRIYDPVYLEGNPSSAPSTVGPGVLSSTRRPLHKQATYQVTGFCWPGASGGPVVNAQGELVGVIRAVLMVEDNMVDEERKVLVPEVCFAAPLPAIRGFLKKAGVL